MGIDRTTKSGSKVCNILCQRLKVNSDLSVTFVQTVEKNQIPYDPAASDATVPRGYVTLPGLSLPPPPLKVTYDLDGKINIKKKGLKISARYLRNFTCCEWLQVPCLCLLCSSYALQGL
jgi:hypothetical protein